MSSVDFGLDVALISIAEGHTNLDLARSALPANCKIPFMAGPDPNPDVSLIICTRNRFEQLAPCLETVQRIEFERPWELIIVNNGRSDERRVGKEC